jgi:phthalate 4,5-cis-dihydrodiol dehydrogenase
MAEYPVVLRLGIIGLGQAIARIFQQYPHIEKLPYRIVAAADLREEARTQFRRQFGGTAYDNAEDLCKDPNVDVVYVATPPHFHRPHVELAAKHKKHVIVEKPMSLSLEDCAAMIACCDDNGVKLLAGHTHSFDAPIRKMREIAVSGALGNVVMINTWNFNDFNSRPWPPSQLDTTKGPILDQGPHQVDLVRQIGGGLVRTVRGQTIWDGIHNCYGGYICLLGFDNGVSASLVFDARAYFDTSELNGWVGEGGAPRDPQSNVNMLRNYEKFAAIAPNDLERVFDEQKNQGRFGAGNIDQDTWKLWGIEKPERVVHQPYFGFTVVSLERGAMRQSEDGLVLYSRDGRAEISLDKEMRGRAAELMDLYNGVALGKTIFHDGRWGMATLEICLAIMQSAREQRELTMTHQVPLPD